MCGWRGDLRVSQSRSATPRTSTSQHCGVPEEQRPTWRSFNIAGIAMEPAKRPLRVKRVTNEVLIFAIGVLILGERGVLEIVGMFEMV
jgi:hypothetical protein